MLAKLLEINFKYWKINYKTESNGKIIINILHLARKKFIK